MERPQRCRLPWLPQRRSGSGLALLRFGVKLELLRAEAITFNLGSGQCFHRANGCKMLGREARIRALRPDPADFTDRPVITLRERAVLKIWPPPSP